MTRQLLDHVYSVVVVLAVFFVILKIVAPSPDAARQSRESEIAPYLDLDILDYSSPLDRAKPLPSAFHMQSVVAVACTTTLYRQRKFA